ncbi:MAG: hypothetical protein RIS47_1358 [Bacteroidota bacterium]
MLVTISISIAATVALAVFLHHPKFGKLPSGERLARIEKSANFQDGKFVNLHTTPVMTEGVNYFTVIKDLLFSANKKPTVPIPTQKTDLLHLDPTEDLLVWFGHSSYFMQLSGKRILVDPVLSGAASPVAFTTRAFEGTDVYTVDELPSIDYLFITHDHWDHLDYDTILKLKTKVGKIICTLGTGAHFEYWGFNPNILIEQDWYESSSLDSGFVVHTLPARHFAGRGLRANKALWAAFLLETPSFKVYIGGDGGYDTHFAEIGAKYGPIDLAILENGQYDKNWKYIHMMPEQVLQAGTDLKAKRLFPVHSGKFALANHAWNEPLRRITALNNARQMPLVTPMIGEKVALQDSVQVFRNWWELELKAVVQP